MTPISPNKLAVYFVADLLWPIWFWPIWLWPILIFRVADMVFCCGRCRLAVADMVVADMVCGRYGRTPRRRVDDDDDDDDDEVSRPLPLPNKILNFTRLSLN